MVFCVFACFRGEERKLGGARRGSGSMDTLLGLLGICGANCAEDRDPETKGRSGGVVSECVVLLLCPRSSTCLLGFIIFVQPPPPARCTSQGPEKGRPHAAVRRAAVFLALCFCTVWHAA